jgi:di/tricarboxylate transporter
VAELSVAALVLAILLSCVSDANVGVVAIVLAWLLGTYIAGFPVGEILSAFPAQLFLTLVGVTLLFSQAHVNGTLGRISRQAIRLCRGNRGVIAIMFFVLALTLSSAGPGNIASAALMAPIAMGIAARANIPAFLAALMVGNGASGGSLSPFAPAGVIVNDIMAKQGFAHTAAQNYFNNLMVHAIVAAGAFLLFGGLGLLRSPRYDERPPVGIGTDSGPERLDTAHVVTTLVIAALVVSVLLFDINVGMAALAGASILTVLKLADEKHAVKEMPWRVIIMVSGVTILVALVEKTGGMTLLTGALASVSTSSTVTGVAAFFTGLISLFSSTSGVVLPALLPTVEGLVQHLGGGNPLAIAASMNVGGHLVDVSPLSTIGALCVACAPAGENGASLFNKLMAWGGSMVAVGALTCWFFFGVLGIP